MSETKRPYVKPIDFKNRRVDLTHGSGGRAMAQLIEELFERSFDNRFLAKRDDQAVFDIPAGRMAMTTDGFVISPHFFPGGNIGSLAVHGTVNDVAMAGAKPLYLSVGMILEEGFPLADLKRVVESMAEAARDADVVIVTGDTKVVEKGSGDGIFITTTGVGVVPEGVEISADRARPGDKVLVSGTMGDHGVAIMSKRENLSFETEIRSDCASLNGMVEQIVKSAPGVHVLRDPTRGGLAAVLNEIALQSNVGVRVREADIPVRQEVHGACELLGLDPVYVANEGKLVAFCAAEDCDAVLSAMRDHALGKDAAVIGEVVEDSRNFVQMETALGGNRIVDWLAGEQLPRIC